MAWDVGNDMVEKENQCIYNICDSMNDAKYIYYEYDEICECYDSFGELTKSEYLGGD